MTNQQTVFTRNATGLVKSISPTTMLFANLGEIGFGTAILTLNLYNGSVYVYNNGYPGGNAVYATLILLAASIFLGYIYFNVVRSVGRTGGDYVWISRNLGPIPGGLLTLGFVFTGIPFIAISLNWLWTLSLGPSLSAIGLVAPTSYPSVVSFVSTLSLNATSSAHLDILVISLILLAAVMLVNLLSPKSGYLMLAGFVVVALIGTIMMAAVYLGLGSSSIQSSISNFLVNNGANSANGGTYSALSTLGAKSYPFSWTATILLLPAAAYTIPWVNNAAAFSGELKNLRRSSWISTIVPMVVSGLLIALFMQLYYSSLGFSFIQASSVLPNGLANTFVYPNMLTVATIAMAKSVPFIWIMNLAFAFWYLASLQQTILAISRYTLGLSFDRIIPVQLSKVNDRFHSPMIALLVAFVVAIPMLVIASYKSWFSIYSTDAMGMAFFAFMGVTAIVYAMKKKDSLKGSATALMISGAIVAIFFLYITYLFLTDKVYLVSNINFYIIIPLWVLGALLYPISRAYYKSKNLDLSLVFKELPPE
jgi:amino acid transporter